LLAGEPGIGKSTIMLQIIDQLRQSDAAVNIGYFSAEEHPSHVNDRWKRVIPDRPEAPMTIFHTAKVEDIIATTHDQNIDVIIVDSIQTVHSGVIESPAGSPNQVRQASELLTALAKKHQVTIFIIGHVTK
jgi:DNA repair protein RadA/Sms